MVGRKTTTAGLFAGLLVGLLLACGSNPESRKQRLLALGDERFELRQFEEASGYYRNALAVDRRFAQAHYRLGLANLELGRQGGAAQAFVRAFELDPDNLDAFRHLAELHFVSLASPTPPSRRSTLDSLITLYKQAEQRHPDAHEVLLVKAEILAYQDAGEEALSLFRQAYARTPESPAVVLGLAASLVQNGLLEEAQRVVEKQLAVEPAADRLYDFLYFLHARNGRRDAAGAVLRAKCDNLPEQTRNWIALAAFCRTAGNDEEADAIVQRLLADPKRYPDAGRLAGDYYLRFGENEAALKLYRLEMSGESANADGNYVSIHSHLAAGDFAAAAREAGQRSDEDPEDLQVVGLRGLLRLHNSETDELALAVEDLRTSLGAQPDNYRLRHHYAHALLASGDTANAEREFREALRTNEDFLPARHAVMELLLARGEFVPAEQEANGILTRFPDDLPARFTLAEAHLGLRRYGEARRELEALRDIESAARRVRLLLARVDLAESKTSGAERALQEILAANPADAEALHALVDLELNRERPDLAQAAVKQALATEPANVDLRVEAGRLAMMRNQNDEAVALLQEIVRDHPRHGPANAYLGELKMRQGNNGAAGRYLRRAMQARPPVPMAYLSFGTALSRERKYDEARPYLERAVQLDPGNAAAHNQLASVLAELGSDPDAALSHAQRAVAGDPHNADFSDTLGYVYLKRRLYANAIEVLDKIVRRHPDRGDYRYHLGLALYEHGELAKARQHLVAAQGARLTDTQRMHVRRLLEDIDRSSNRPTVGAGLAPPAPAHSLEGGLRPARDFSPARLWSGQSC